MKRKPHDLNTLTSKRLLRTCTRSNGRPSENDLHLSYWLCHEKHKTASTRERGQHQRERAKKGTTNRPRHDQRKECAKKGTINRPRHEQREECAKKGTINRPRHEQREECAKKGTINRPRHEQREECAKNGTINRHRHHQRVRPTTSEKNRQRRSQTGPSKQGLVIMNEKSAPRRAL